MDEPKNFFGRVRTAPAGRTVAVVYQITVRGDIACCERHHIAIKASDLSCFPQVVARGLAGRAYERAR